MCQACCTEVPQRDWPTTTAVYASEAVKESRLVDEFRFAIDDLAGALSELTERVRPVSRSEYPEPGGTQNLSTPDSSEARSELYRLHVLTGVLRGVTDRLEV